MALHDDISPTKDEPFAVLIFNYLELFLTLSANPHIVHWFYLIRHHTDLLDRPAHMKQLYDICAAPSKTWKPLPGGDHNSSVLEDGYFEAMADFVSEVTSDTAKEKERL